MVPWITLVVVGLMVAALLYTVLSVFLEKSLGLYIATAFHIVLGTLSLLSIGLYILGLALMELIIEIIMTVKLRGKRTA